MARPIATSLLRLNVDFHVNSLSYSLVHGPHIVISLKQWRTQRGVEGSTALNMRIFFSTKILLHLHVMLYVCFSAATVNTGVYPPTTKALFPQLPPFPLPSPFPLSLPFPPLVLPSMPSCREAAPLKPTIRGLGSAASSPNGVCGEAPADIDFDVFSERKKLV